MYETNAAWKPRYRSALACLVHTRSPSLGIDRPTLQAGLLRAGYFPGDEEMEDWVFGGGTQSALLTFQAGSPSSPPAVAARRTLFCFDGRNAAQPGSTSWLKTEAS